jgi:two-component sensor histidine kinase
LLSAATEQEFVAASVSCSASDVSKYVLLREMHHRVANSFAVLNAILRRELRTSPSTDPQVFLDRCEARIVAFGELHRVLTIGEAVGWVPVQPYIEKLCGALAEALLTPLGVRCEVSAGPAFFPGEYCELLGLVIAELVTNAAKHAFPGRNDGVVRIQFLTTVDSWTCVISDNGVGASATSIGTGTKILATLLRALGARLVRKSGPGGTSAMVSCPFQGEFAKPKSI